MFEVEKNQLRRRAGSRFMPKAVEPFFSAFLVMASLFMAVMLFGAGSWIGGVLFSLVLIPTGVVLYDEFFGSPDPEPQTDAQEVAADPWDDRD